MNYTLKDFVDGKFAINCETEEEAKELMDRISKEYAEVKWVSGTKISKDLTRFEVYLSDISYNIENGKMTYSSYGTCTEYFNYDIVKYKDLEKEDDKLKICCIFKW